MSESEFKERVLSELAELKADVRELRKLGERVRAVEVRALMLSTAAALVVTFLLREVSR